MCSSLGLSAEESEAAKAALRDIAHEKGTRQGVWTNYTIYDDDTGLSVSVSCETALQILAALEVYALDCLSITNKHKAAVKALTTVDEVAAYDYKSGYPDKLTFTL